MDAMEHGFPAQQRTLRAARVRSTRDCYSAACRVRPRQTHQRIVIHGLDRREIAMGDVFRPRRGADVVRDRVQRQIDDLARIGRDVAGRAVHQIAVEHQHAAGLAGGRDDAAFLHQPRHGFLVQRPQRIGGGLEIVRGLEVAGVLALRHQHQGAVDRHHLVEEDRDVHRARLAACRRRASRCRNPGATARRRR